MRNKGGSQQVLFAQVRMLLSCSCKARTPGTQALWHTSREEPGRLKIPFCFCFLLKCQIPCSHHLWCPKCMFTDQVPLPDTSLQSTTPLLSSARVPPCTVFAVLSSVSPVSFLSFYSTPITALHIGSFTHVYMYNHLLQNMGSGVWGVCQVHLYIVCFWYSFWLTMTWLDNSNLVYK